MKIPISALLAVATTVALAGCTSRPVQPRIGLMVLDTLIGSGTTHCRVEYRFATILNAEESPALNAVERSITSYFFELEDFSGTARAAAEAALREVTDEYLDLLSAKQTYEISVESEAAVVDTLLTFAITRSSYLGGAHGSYGTECHNYTLSDGYELSIADLFAPEQLPVLDSLIRNKLLVAYGAGNDAELAAAGFFLEYIGPTENFLVTPDGLTFHYDPYEIGCYALGAVEVEISHEELDRIGR